MYAIDVDFEVYKQLTVRRATEDVTYNDVIREMLDLPHAKTSGATAKTTGSSQEDWVTQGIRFPAGTEFQVTYKGKTYDAVVQNGSLMLDGKQFNSPSAAAISITGGNVNGWRFWKCKLPGTHTWQLIERLRK